MTFLAHDYTTVSQSGSESGSATTKTKTGGIGAFLRRVGQSFARARQRHIEREYLRGNFYQVSKDTGIDSTHLRHEIEKPFWRR